MLGCASALAPPPGLAAETATQTFTQAGEQQFVVPAAVTSLQLLLIGGNGGSGGAGSMGGIPEP